MATPAELDRAVDAALQHHVAGRLSEAEAVYRQVIAQSPRHPRALHFLAAAYATRGLNDEALALFRRALDADPANADVHSNYAKTLRDAGRPAESIPQARTALAINPNFAEAHNNIALALWDLKRFEEARAAAAEAVRLKPGLVEAHNNLGLALRGLHRFDEAMVAFERAFALKPDFVTALNNAGECLWAAGRFFEAVDAGAHAVALVPNDPDAHWNLAMLRMLTGDLRRGFIEYEWRWRRPQFYGLTPQWNFRQPAWDGSALHGKTILLHSEQGFGDAIQFVRYVYDVRAIQPAKIVLICQPDLARLLGSVEGVDEIIHRGDPLPPFDVHLPLMSLPRVFGTTLETIPAPPSYLRAPADAAEKWRDRLAAEPFLPRLRVGLCWAGRPTHEFDRERSMTLAALGPLATAQGVRFYSLQKGDAAAQARTPPPGMDLVDYTADLTDFADTAGLIEQLDLVVTIDSAPAHLAAALGRPTWVLLHVSPEWRWLIQRPDSPWYPSMRLFRQTRREDWSGPVERAAEALRAMANPPADEC